MTYLDKVVKFVSLLALLFLNQGLFAQGPNPKVGLQIGGSKNPNSLCEGDSLDLINLTKDSAQTVDYYVFNFNWKNDAAYPNIIDTIKGKDSVTHVYLFHDSIIFKNCKKRFVKLYVSLTAVDTFGDEFEIVSNITLFFKPRARLAAQSSACVGEEVTLSNYSCPLDSVNFKWEVEGKKYTTKDAKHTFKTPGKHKIKLTTTAGNPCASEDSMISYINVYDFPKPDLKFQSLRKNDVICYGKDTLQMINTSSKYTSIQWNINPSDTNSMRLVNNSNFASDTLFFVPYKTTEFSVQLRANNYVCSDTTKTYKFKVIVSPEVTLKTMPQCVDSSYFEIGKFIDTTSGLPDAYKWKLTSPNKSDSSISTFPHHFNNLVYGKHYFEFQSNGICDTFVHFDSFFVAPKVQKIRDTITLCNSKDTIVYLKDAFGKFPTGFGETWTLDSSITSNSFNPYNKKKGIYTVYLTDSNSACYNDSIFIKVIDFKYTRHKDTAVCVTRDSFNFATKGGGSYVGKGVVGSTFYPSKSGVGTFKIVYISDASAPCPFKDTFNLVVTDTLHANFSVKSPNCKDSTFVFKNLTKAPVLKWIYGNGSEGDSSQNSIKYKSSGIYYAKQIIGLKGGCLDSATKKIVVHDKPSLTHKYSVDSSSCDSVKLTFYITNPDTAQTYRWDVGGQTFTGDTVQHTVVKNDKSDYQISYVISGASICGSIADSSKIRIPPKFHAGIAIKGPSKFCTPFTTSFTNQTYGQVDSFLVDYGNGQRSKNTLVGMTYYNSGTTDTSYKIRITASNGTCGRNEDSVVITVAPNNISPTFSVNNPGCTKTDFKFVNTSSDSISSWNFGDGNSNTAQNPVHQYTKAGSYSVTARYKAAYGCVDSTQLKVIVHDKPLLTQKYVVDSSSCDSVKLTFYITNPDTAQTYKWDIGGQTFTGDTVQHTVVKNDKSDYQISYVISGASICGSIADSSKIRIPPKFHAGIAIKGLSKFCTPFTASFTNQTYGQVDSFLVDYGNGQKSKNTLVGMTYYNSGTTDTFYKIRITAYNGKCGRNEDSVIITVAPNNISPTFSVNNPGCTKTDFKFVNTSSDSISSWNFGDGNSNTTQNPVHQYTKAGSYSVTARYKAAYGCVDSAQLKVIVHDKPLLAHKYLVDSSSCDSVKLTFYITNPDTAQTYQWDIGGQSFTGDTVQHTVAKNDKTDYQISYLISGASICGSIADSSKIRIPPKFHAGIAIKGPSKFCTPFATSFTNQTYGQVDSFLVDYGNGQKSKNTLVGMTYYNSGTTDTSYKIRITAFNGKCGRNEDSVVITVAPNNISPTYKVNNPGCLDSFFRFTNTSSDSIVTWYFGDGSSSTNQIASHKYNKIGVYQVEAIYKAAWGCLDSVESMVRVIKSPTVKYQFSLDSTRCDTVMLKVEVLNPDSVNQYKWVIGSKFQSNKTVDSFPLEKKYFAYNQRFNLQSTNICGNIDLLDSASVNVGFKADVVIDGLNTGCSPFVPTFNNHTTGVVKDFYIDYGNGDTSVNRIKKTTFTNSSDSTKIYPVVLYAYNIACGMRTDTVYVYVKPNNVKPIGQYTKNWFCTNEVVSFINNSSPEAKVRMLWGDGTEIFNIQFGDTLKHTFKIPGKYTASVIAESCGIDTSFDYKIQIEGEPKADFISSPIGLCASLPVLFTKSTDSSYTSLWRVDGKDTAQRSDSFSKIFSQAGTYSVEMVVSSLNAHCVDSVKKNIVIEAAPTMNVKLDNSVGCIPNTVCAHITGNIKFATIDWGNGQGGDLRDTCITYSKSDTFDIIFSGSTANGCPVKDDKQVFVYPELNTSYSLTIDSTSCSNVLISGKVNLPNKHLNYHWKIDTFSIIGDHFNVTIQKSVFRKYLSLDFQVSSVCGSKNYQDIIPIPPKWKARFGVSGLSEGCSPFTPKFINLTQGSFESFEVDYGDGTKSKNYIDNKSFVNNSDTNRTYQIVLTIFNKTCIPDSDTVEIVVRPNSVKLAEEHSVNQYCLGEEMTMINRSSPDAKITFYFGDGTSYTDNFAYGVPIKHIYQSAGEYSVSAATRNPCLGDSVYLFTVTILEKPIIDFDASNYPICEEVTSSLISKTKDATNLFWVVDNLDTFIHTNPLKYKFHSSGDHLVKLRAESVITGCTDELEKQIIISPRLDYQFLVDTPVCVNQITCAHFEGNITSAKLIWGNNTYGSLNDTCTKYTMAGPVEVSVEVRTNEGCFNVDSQRVVVHPNPIVTILPDQDILKLDIGNSTYITFDKSQAYSKYYWFHNNDTICEYLNLDCDPIKVGPYDRTTQENYVITLVDEFGCSSSDSIFIHNSSGAGYYIPNAFSPNGDRDNEYFRPIIYDEKIESYNMMIFNRWGEILFDEENLAIDFKGWDGTYHKDDRVVSVPTLFEVVIKFNPKGSSEENIYIGYIMLMK